MHAYIFVAIQIYLFGNVIRMWYLYMIRKIVTRPGNTSLKITVHEPAVSTTKRWSHHHHYILNKRKTACVTTLQRCYRGYRARQVHIT